MLFINKACTDITSLILLKYSKQKRVKNAPELLKIEQTILRLVLSKNALIGSKLAQLCPYPVNGPPGPVSPLFVLGSSPRWTPHFKREYMIC